MRRWVRDDDVGGKSFSEKGLLYLKGLPSFSLGGHL